MTRYFLKFIIILILTNLSFTSIANDKILLIGDSLSAGYGLKQAQTWVYLLQKKLIFCLSNQVKDISHICFNIETTSPLGKIFIWCHHGQ
jgi:acyl-CoA thioesterase-1